jgi:hypothetical protein
MAGPTLAELRDAVSSFAGAAQPDRSSAAFNAATESRVDLSVAEHRVALHKWLNAWGCRIRYPRNGEIPMFDRSLAGWWVDWHARLPRPDVTLAALNEAQIDDLAEAFGDLASRAVAPARKPGSSRTLGPTAAAKSLYALRPRAVPPWDDAIATRLHGRRDAVGFASHLRLMRTWSRALLAEARASEEQVAARVGRPTESLAKLLDEYCFMTITFASRRAAP